MANDLEKLVVQLSADIKGYEIAMRKAVGVSNTQARAIENRAKQMNRNLDSLGKQAARAFVAPVAGISAALSIREVTRYADAWTVAGNKIAAASQVSGMQARSLEGLNEIANDTRSGISETADLYAKLMRSASGVAQSEAEVAKATAIVNKAFKAGGAAASEQAAGILQLSQGLGSGVLQGDELRSVRENAPLLAQAIADFFGTSVAGLKKLGEEGQLTSDKVFQAILSAQPKIEAAFARTNSTISEGMTRVNNAFTQYIGQSDSSLGATQRLVQGLTALADNFDQIADVTVKVAAIIAGGLLGRSIAGMVAQLGLAAGAAAKFVSAIRAASSMAGLATAMTGLTAAAGPLGLVIGGTAVAALVAYTAWTDGAASATDLFREEMDRTAKAEQDASANAVKSAAEREQAYRKAREELEKLNRAAGEGPNQVANAIQQMNGMLGYLQEMSGVWGIDDATLQTLDDLVKRAKAGEITVGELDATLDNLSASRPDLGDWLGQLGTLARTALAASGALQSLIERRDALAAKITADEGSMSAEQRSGYAQYYSSRAEGEKVKAEGQAYIAEALRRNALTKEALALENEIASVQKESAKAGVALTEAQVRQIALSNLAAKKPAGGGSRALSKADLDERDAIKEAEQIYKATRTAAEEYGYEVEKLSGLLQGGYISQDTYNRGLKGAEERLTQAGQFSSSVADALKGGFEGLFTAIIDGSDSAGEAVENLGKRLAAMALQESVFRLLAMMMHGTFGAQGFMPLVKGMAEGGYTGPGGKYQPAGIVHAGEYVFDQQSVKAAGGPAALDAMRRNLRGYANGGYVGLPSVPAAGRSSPGNIQIINQTSGSVDEVSTETSRGPNGMEMTRIVMKEFGKGTARGMGDKAMQARFGARPTKVRRG